MGARSSSFCTHISEQDVNSTENSSSHTALISCGKRKASDPAPARDLYQGDLFQKSLAYAEQVVGVDESYILSAKHGLIALDEVIAPYEMTLNTMGVADIREWADRVLGQLWSVADLEKDRFTILAGANYRKFLVPHMRNVEVPLEGLMFGQQLRFLKQALDNV